MIIVRTDSHHPEWFKAPEPVWLELTKEWDIPKPLGENRLAELDVLALIPDAHSRCVACDVEYDHETKQRICTLKFDSLTADELATVRKLTGVEITEA